MNNQKNHFSKTDPFMAHFSGVRLQSSTLKIIYLFFMAVSVFAIAGCKPAAIASSPGNDTSRLDSIAQNDPKSAEFARRVELYYQALQNKDWPATYDMRTANYKRLVSEELYLREMTGQKMWNLDSYKVLNITLVGEAGGYRAAQLILETSENGSVSYSCAVWKYADGTWLCEEPGVSVGILRSLNPPDWYKN